MKILYWSPYVGHVGTIKAVINSARALRDNGKHEVTLIKNHSEWEGYEELVQRSGVKVHNFGLKRLFPNLVRTSAVGSRIYMLTVAFFGFFQLFNFIRKERPDILIANLIVLPAILCTRLFRKPPTIVVSIQGFPKFLGEQPDNYPFWMKLEDGLRKWLWNRLYNCAELLVCMTPSTKDKLIKQTSLDPNKLVVINNPIVDENIESLSKQVVEDKWLFNTDYQSLVAIGRLTPQKDFMTLIKAIELVRQDVAVHVAILGDGEEKTLLQKEIDARDLGDCIKLYGFISNPYAYLKQADLFILTSLWEDPGHVILEAAALKTPIVSTDCPSGPATLLSFGKGGELCRMGAIDELSQAIIKVLTDDAEITQQKCDVAYINAKAFSLDSHFQAYQPYLKKWQLRLNNES